MLPFTTTTVILSHKYECGYYPTFTLPGKLITYKIFSFAFVNAAAVVILLLLSLPTAKSQSTKHRDQDHCSACQNTGQHHAKCPFQILRPAVN